MSENQDFMENLNSGEELLHIFHNVLPYELKKFILRIWFTSYYQKFCLCRAKKEKRYIYDINSHKFYRACCKDRTKLCNKIGYEITYIWPYVDYRIETDILSKLKYLNKDHIQFINEILYQDSQESSHSINSFMKLYNKIFAECQLQNEAETYMIIAWQLYKAKKRNVQENRIMKICRCARFLGRYWIPANKGILISKNFFTCSVDELTSYINLI